MSYTDTYTCYSAVQTHVFDVYNKHSNIYPYLTFGLNFSTFSANCSKILRYIL